MGWFDQQKQRTGDAAGATRPQGTGTGGRLPAGGQANRQPGMPPKRTWLTFFIVLLRTRDLAR